jgi:hypothetical protein
LEGFLRYRGEESWAADFAKDPWSLNGNGNIRVESLEIESLLA